MAISEREGEIMTERMAADISNHPPVRLGENSIRTAANL